VEVRRRHNILGTIVSSGAAALIDLALTPDEPRFFGDAPVAA
jgi:hypothetical protein